MSLENKRQLIIKYCHPLGANENYFCPYDNGHYSYRADGAEMYCPGGPKSQKGVRISPGQDGGTIWQAGEKWGWVPEYTLVTVEDSDVEAEPPGSNHYRNLGIEPLEYIVANNLGFVAGNVIKYVTRAPFKNGLEDLKKARYYLDILIEKEENG